MMRYVILFCVLCCATITRAGDDFVWRTFPQELAVARHFHAVAALSDHEVLVIGGLTNSVAPNDGMPTASCEIIDFAMMRVLPGPSLNHARAETGLVKGPDGALYAVGGVGSAGVESSIERFDPDTRTWSVVGRLLTGRRQPAVTFISDTHILIAGGRYTNLQSMDDVEIFDLSTGLSVETTPYPYAMTQAVAFRGTDGKGRVVGGRAGGPNSARVSTVNRFDDATWTESADLGIKICSPTVLILHDGSAVIAGGAERESPVRTIPYAWMMRGDSVQRFDLVSGRQHHGMAIYAPDMVVVAGGTGDDLNVLRTSEFVDPILLTSRPGPDMLTPRWCMPLVSISGAPSGDAGPTIVAVSGHSIGANVASIEYLTATCSEGGIRDLLAPFASRVVGSAKAKSASVLLTDTSKYAAGALWTTQKVAVQNGFASEFIVRFENGNDNAQPEGSAPGADGVAFCIQQSSSAPLGFPGEGIGYENIANCVAVEFDSYLNAHYTDPNGSHVAIQTGGTGQVKAWHVAPYMQRSSALPMELRSGETYRIRVEYTPGRLDVFVNWTPVLSWDPVDLASVIKLDKDGGAWIGITSATGKSVESHEILAWTVDNCGEPATHVEEEVGTTASIALSPNPASETVTITTPNSAQARRIVIADLAGRIVASVDAPLHEHTIDVSALPSGVYVVRIEGAERPLALPLSIVR